MKRILGKIIAFAVAAVTVFLIFWFTLPPLNLRSPDFWIFTMISLLIFVAAFFCGSLVDAFQMKKTRHGVEHISFDRQKLPKPLKITLWVILAIIPCMILASLIGTPLFNAARYRDLLQKENGVFAEDVAELSMSQIPVVDRDTSSALGKRKLGEMADLVSQFEIAENYTQINLQNRPTRVTPLLYGDFIKWINNSGKGIPAYIQVDMVTQEASLVRLKEGMRYTESDLFMRYIHRYLRFAYPTFIFDDVSFEVDDNGTPYWIASTVSYRIGVWSGRDISGAVLVNAITGERNYYPLEKIPSWVDQVFSSDMILTQLNDNGQYVHGFFNAYFGQKDVLRATDGYNYLAINDDVWLYTGLTSAVSDESNVGFVLINLRTKETKYYAIPGAEEYSAMDSAEGQVQEKNYRATFPLLLNVANRPTYFLSLKDGAGLVKMYAFVDVEQYQIVGTGSSLSSARENYISKLTEEAPSQNDTNPNTDLYQVVNGTISEIQNVVIEGNTVYYLKLQNDTRIFSAPVTISPNLPFLLPGSPVTISFVDYGTAAPDIIPLKAIG